MRLFRWILFPFSLIYGAITILRNACYSLGVFKVYSIPVKSICVGNLSTGGTGKTPHVAWIAEQLKDSKRLIILSRGYGRKTTGFRWVTEDSTSLEVGDEPLLYKKKYGNLISVAVCEKRKAGIEKILKDYPDTELILLDDSFQHRAVKAGLNILLTDFSKPYFSDFMLPTGNLREPIVGKKRADVVIVTKCPSTLSSDDQSVFYEKLNIRPKPAFFSSIQYGTPEAFGSHEWGVVKKAIVVTGIARPEPLIEYLLPNYEIEHLNYSDHHNFSEEDIRAIHQKFDTFAHDNTVILTTEKDYMRITSFYQELKMEKYPWFYIPITVKFENEERIKSIIDQYVGTI